MDNEKWDNYLVKNTAEYGELSGGDIDSTDKNHLSITFDFFRELNIDNKDKTFLDIGCGKGRTNVTKAKWSGIDLVHHDINNNIVKCDAHELLFLDKEFDIIFSSHTLEHTLSPLICLLEMNRVLKNDGDLIIGVPLYPGFVYPGHNYVLTEGGWKHLIQQAGFDIVDTKIVVHCGVFHCKKNVK
jgi:ubiquinone/menaquinone biosynthesis C-methylase UbiE